MRALLFFLLILPLHGQVVDPTSLKGKVMCGYQGWFGTPDDTTHLGWRHYAGGNREPIPGRCTFDIWPDMSESTEGEKFATTFKTSGGAPTYLFSSRHPLTVGRHFKWMKDYGIDGVFLQRFVTSVRSDNGRLHCDTVLGNVRVGARSHGRVWAMMYDLSGLKKGEIEKVAMADWRGLEKKKITNDSTYLHHEGKPLVAVWGVGFNDGRDYTLAECEALVRFLKDSGNSVMLGVPTSWRELKGDSVRDKKLHEIIKLADIISPWAVGRFGSPKAATKREHSYLKPDLAWATQHKKSYLPVIFPGFSWENLKKLRGEKAKFNHIPRRKGEFLWSQATAAKRAGAEMIYVAMFDEIDEATAIFKTAKNPPIGESRFLDNEGLPPDHYLWLTGEIGRMLRGDLPPTEKAPTSASRQ